MVKTIFFFLLKTKNFLISTGKIASSLKVHPDNKHIIFPLGNKVSIMSMDTNKQEFLCGHTNTISNVDVSKRFRNKIKMFHSPKMLLYCSSL